MKVKLGEEGFNPSVIKDPLFYLEDNKGYVPMTPEIFSSIAEGKAKLWVTSVFVIGLRGQFLVDTGGQMMKDDLSVSIQNIPWAPLLSVGKML